MHFKGITYNPQKHPSKARGCQPAHIESGTPKRRRDVFKFDGISPSTYVTKAIV